MGRVTKLLDECTPMNRLPLEPLARIFDLAVDHGSKEHAKQIIAFMRLSALENGPPVLPEDVVHGLHEARRPRRHLRVAYTQPECSLDHNCQVHRVIHTSSIPLRGFDHRDPRR